MPVTVTMFPVLTVALLHLAASMATAESQEESVHCPDRCLCFRTTVRCMFLQLDHVPHVPVETTILDLRFNKIRDIPTGTFRNLKNLNTLLLNNNNIVKLENDAFNGLKELRYLYLYKNRIKIIEGRAFNGLNKIEQLYLHFNRIETLETETFSDLRTLDRLFLHNNKLTRIPPDVFRNMDSLRRLRLDSNALICDCKMMWLARMLKDKSTTTQAAATCEFPSVLQGKSLTSVNEADFRCEKPSLTEEPHDVEVSFGGTAYFTCKADGDPNPDIIWLHNENEIKLTNGEEERRYSVLNDGTLMIENTQSMDQGVYECMAKNALGEVKSRKAKMKHHTAKVKNENDAANKPAHVNAKFSQYDKGKPRFIQTPQGQEVRLGEAVTLFCEASGSPQPEIAWSLNDNPLLTRARFDISASGTLTISNVRSEDSGVYRCSASNLAGQITTFAQIKVQVPPVIDEKPRNQVLSEGRPIDFFCKAHGSPEPHITWFKDGRTIVPGVRLEIDSTGNHLRIGSLRKSDEGIYTCRAQNVAGVADVSASLFVKAKIRPTFSEKPQDVEIAPGNEVEFRCNADGDPPPIFIWRKNGATIIGDQRHQLFSDGTLRLFGVGRNDAGVYECTADNGIGFITASAHLKIREEHARPGDRFVQVSIEEARASVDRALNDTIRNIYSRDKPFTPAEILRLFRFPGPSAREIARSAEIYERTLLIIKRHVEAGAHFNLSEFSYVDALSPSHLESIANLSGCLSHRHNVSCSEMCFHSRYRTVDGTCNNLQHPMWGASETAFYRLLRPIYENGFNTPVGWSRSPTLYHGFLKPSARLVSTRVVSTDDITPDDDYSHMLMQWGQFLDHDLDLAPPTISSESFVDGEDCSQSCNYAAPCFPIEIPPGDPRIKNQNCMEFTRSSAICGSGSTSLLFESVMPREQINVLTSYIDASQVYGSGKVESDQVRDLSNNLGLLRRGLNSEVGKPLLPFSEDWPIDCRRDPRESNVGCFLAGDIRVNEQLGLITMHTIWFREHNRIAEELHRINPQWDGESLYQESRKIVGAQMQHITYYHWLPKIFGTRGMEMLGPYTGYNPNVESSISNAFATAALRFGHTLINPILHRLNSSFQPISQGHLPLSLAFFSPFRIMEEGGIDPLLRGLFVMPAKIRKSNQLLNKELTEQLFRQVHAVALDLAAINIQRSRDHALPGYNRWRQLCNLSVANTFHDLRHEIKSKDLRDSLKQLYGHPDNIDLWVGGISEELVPGARVGPTFLCILVDQFRRLRDGDRFYYENPGVFKPDQLVQIKQSSLSKVVCDNGDDIQDVTLDAFVIPQKQNPSYHKCDQLPKIDLRFWSFCCHECSQSQNFYTPRHEAYLSGRAKRSMDHSYPTDRPFTISNTSLQFHTDINTETTVTKVLNHQRSIFEEDLIEERVEGMEEVIRKMQRQLKQLNKKVKKLERDCQSGRHAHCIDSTGRSRFANETWNLDKCSTCHCKDGQITCRVKTCLIQNCNNLSIDKDECCPAC